MEIGSLSPKDAAALLAYIRSLESTVEQQMNTLTGLKVGLPPHVPQTSTELAAFIGRLEAEVAALKQPVVGEEEFQTGLQDLENAYSIRRPPYVAVDRLISLHRAALRDAGRYRWLRTMIYIDSVERVLRISEVFLKPGPIPASLDAAIDAAIQKEKGDA